MHPSHPQPDPDKLKEAALKFYPDILWTAVVVSTSFAVLYGLFLTLAAVSVYLLLRRDIRRPLSAIQLFAVTALLVSTTTHWAVVVLQRFGNLLVHPDKSLGDLKTTFLVEQCVGTATLTINVVLSDLVVWWRAWVLWPNSRIVRVCGCVLLFATFAMGVVDTNSSCKAEGGFMYEGLFFGTVASALSLATNLAATILTAYQAWAHRKMIRRHVASGTRNSQVEGIFALLVESGALYCALWVVVVVWQVGIDNPHIKSSIFYSEKHNPHATLFWIEGGVLIEGCLVPLILSAIYPTIIIVLVALNKSAVENGLKRDEGPAAIAVAVNPVVDMHSDLDDDPTRSPTYGVKSISDSNDSHEQLRGEKVGQIV